MAVRVVRLDPAQCDAIWDHVADGFRLSCKSTGDFLSPAWLRQQCVTGLAAMFAADDGGTFKGACVVQLQDTPGGTVGRFLGMMGADVNSWKDEMRAVVTQWAKSHGAKWLVDDGRPGIKRIVPDAEVVSVTYRIAI